MAEKDDPSLPARIDDTQGRTSSLADGFWVNPMTPRQARATEFASLTFFLHITMSGMTAAQSRYSDIHRD
jgi:hypothetical protein